MKLGNLLDTADDDLPRQFHQQQSKLADQLTQRNRRVLQLPDEARGSEQLYPASVRVTAKSSSSGLRGIARPIKPDDLRPGRAYGERRSEGLSGTALDIIVAYD